MAAVVCLKDVEGQLVRSMVYDGVQFADGSWFVDSDEGLRAFWPEDYFELVGPQGTDEEVAE